MEQFTFSEPLYFLLLFFLLLLWYIFYKREKKTFFGVGFFADIQSIYSEDCRLYRWYKVAIFSIFSVFVLLLASPSITRIEKQLPQNGIDIVLVLDVSVSMEAQDMQPNRITVAKNVIEKFIHKLEGDRVGVVLFSGRPFASVPLTFDYEFLQDFFKNVSTSIIDQHNSELQGTALGDGLLLGSHMLETASKENKTAIKREQIMIVLTDGEANKGIDPTISLRSIKEKNIKVYTIGVGGNTNTFIQQLDAFGRVLQIPVGAIDEKTLKQIASETGGKYFSAQNEKTFEEVFDTIAQLEKTEIIPSSEKIHTPYNGVFIMLLLFGYMIVLFAYFKNIKI